MAQLIFTKLGNTTLILASPDTGDFLYHKINIGAVLYADFRKVPNPKFHRLYFSLLNPGFKYWTPTGRTISPDEKSLIRGYSGYLINLVAHDSIILECETDYLKSVMEQRAARVTLLKSFDAFRRWTTIRAGYFQFLPMPDRAIIKKSRSIPLLNVDDTEFAEPYKATLSHFILNKTFSTPAVAENAASRLQCNDGERGGAHKYQTMTVQVVWGCSACHDEGDRRTHYIDNETARLFHAEGVMRTQYILIAGGKL